MKKLLMILSLAVLSRVGLGANAWMQEARKTPAWFTEGVMYQIQPRAFTPEGTLKSASRIRPSSCVTHGARACGRSPSARGDSLLSLSCRTIVL